MRGLTLVTVNVYSMTHQVGYNTQALETLCLQLYVYITTFAII